MSAMEVPNVLDPLTALSGTEHLFTQILALLCRDAHLLECRLVNSSWRDLVTHMQGGVFFRRAKAQASWSPNDGGVRCEFRRPPGVGAIACNVVAGQFFWLLEDKLAKIQLKLEAFKITSRELCLDHPIKLWEYMFMSKFRVKSGIFTDRDTLIVYTDQFIHSSVHKITFTRFNTRSLQLMESSEIVREDYYSLHIPIQVEAHVAMTGNHSIVKEYRMLRERSRFPPKWYTDNQGKILLNFNDAAIGHVFIVWDHNMNKIVDRCLQSKESVCVKAFVHPVVILDFYFFAEGLAAWNLEAAGSPAAIWSSKDLLSHAILLVSPTKLLLTSKVNHWILMTQCLRLPPPDAINVSGQRVVGEQPDGDMLWFMQSESEACLQLPFTTEHSLEFYSSLIRLDADPNWTVKLLDSSDWHLVYGNRRGLISITDFWNV